MEILIREVAVEGNSKVLVTIGCKVVDVISNGRWAVAIGICANATVSETMPAPNASVKGGYDTFHQKISNIIQENV